MNIHYEVGIVGHPDRRRDHLRLKEMTGGFVQLDDGELGCDRNHLRTWQGVKALLDLQCPRKAEGWGVVVEDDAVPIPEFKRQLALALSAAPTPVVSLYLGTGHPSLWQPKIKKATEAAAEVNSAWIVGEHLLHGVGYAMRQDLIADMLDEVPTDSRIAIDARITIWLRGNRHLVSYAFPSLVDHLDERSIIGVHPDGRPRNRPRHAWAVGSRDQRRSRPVLL